MSSVILFTLVVFAECVTAWEQATEQAANAHDLTDKLFDTVVDTIFGQPLQAWSIQHADLENTTDANSFGRFSVPRSALASFWSQMLMAPPKAKNPGMCSVLPQHFPRGTVVAGSSIFGDDDSAVAKSTIPTQLRRAPVNTMATSLQASPGTASPPSWSELEDALRARGRDYAAERAATVAGERGPHTDAKLRLFGKKESDVRVTLYRDTAAWCPYCQKTWMLLEEKRIPFRVEKINMRSYGPKPAEFLAKVPNGLLPAIELDGQLMTDSQRIMMKLEQVFDGPEYSPPGYITVPRITADPTLTELADKMLRLERELFAAWCQWCFRPGDGPGGMARQGFETVMDKVEAALAASPGAYFLGEMSLVDLVYVPHLERIAASIEYWKGMVIRGGAGTKRWPQINAWFDALETRENGVYMATQSDWYTHVKDIPPQYGDGYFGGDHETKEGQRLMAAIDGGVDRDGSTSTGFGMLDGILRAAGAKGTAGSSADALERTPSEWRLPLPSMAECPQVVLPVNDPGDEEAKLQAAERLVYNNADVVRFALRGAGQPGLPPYQAPLADPNAVPSEDKTLKELVDELLRSIAAKMIGAADGAAASPTLASGAGNDKAAEAAACLDYLRGRIGVPRDMRLPAARQFRAHLTWAMDEAMKSAA